MKAAVVEAFGKPLVLREWEYANTGRGPNFCERRRLRRASHRPARSTRRLACKACANVYTGS